MKRALPGFFTWSLIYWLSCKVAVMHSLAEDDPGNTLYFCLLCLSYIILAFALKSDWRVLIPSLVVTFIACVWKNDAVHAMYVQARLVEPGDAPLTSEWLAMDVSIAVVPPIVICCLLPQYSKRKASR